MDSSPFIRLDNTAEATGNESVPTPKAAEFIAVPTELVESESSDDPVMGSDVKDSGYKFKLQFTRKGAAIKSATLSEYDDRDHKNPQPLVLLSPIEVGEGKEICSLANGNLDVPSFGKRYALDMIDWTPSDVVTAEDGTQTVEFRVVLKAEDEDALRVVKTYTVKKDSYDVGCEIKIENLSDKQVEAKINMQGPAGIERESYRDDGRDVMSAYNVDGAIETIKRPARDLRNAIKKGSRDKLKLGHKNATAELIWVASTNKYFAAIVRQDSASDIAVPGGFRVQDSEYYDEDINDTRNNNGNEELSLKFGWDEVKLGASGEDNSTSDITMSVFVGPKDKGMFDKHPVYKELQYFQTINFRSCFCWSKFCHSAAGVRYIGADEGHVHADGAFRELRRCNHGAGIFDAISDASDHEEESGFYGGIAEAWAEDGGDKEEVRK